MMSNQDEIQKLAAFMAFGGNLPEAAQYFKDAEAAEILHIQSKYALAREGAATHQKMWTEADARIKLLGYLDHLEFCLRRIQYQRVDDVRSKLHQDIDRVVEMVCREPLQSGAIPAIPVVPNGLSLTERLWFFNVPTSMTEEVAASESQLIDVVQLPSEDAYWLVNVTLDTPYGVMEPSVFGRSWLTLAECMSLGACIEPNVVEEFAVRKQDDIRKNMVHVRELAHPSMEARGSLIGLPESQEYPRFLLGPHTPEKYVVSARIASCSLIYRVFPRLRPMAASRIG